MCSMQDYHEGMRKLFLEIDEMSIGSKIGNISISIGSSHKIRRVQDWYKAQSSFQRDTRRS